MIKYFHQLTDKGYKSLFGKGLTWEKLAIMHPQPKWCSYPDAIMGEMGCWKLQLRGVSSEQDCKNCECFVQLKARKRRVNAE